VAAFLSESTSAKLPNPVKEACHAECFFCKKFPVRTITSFLKSTSKVLDQNSKKNSATEARERMRLKNKTYLAHEGAPAAGADVFPDQREDVRRCHSREGPGSDEVGEEHGAVVEGVRDVGSVRRQKPPV
jgi:hypothetical protein